FERDGVIVLSGERFQLKNLHGLQQLAQGLRPEEAQVQHNTLETLAELGEFTSLKRINATGNRIGFLCSTFDKPTLNQWPKRMGSLVELNLSFNRLTSIPGLVQMPSLRVLNLQSNAITTKGFQQLAQGRNLEELDLSTNQLAWKKGGFMVDSKVFRVLTKLKRVNLAGNKFIDQVPDYHFVILAQVRAKRRLTGSRPLAFIDEHVVNREMKNRADAIRRDKTFAEPAGLTGRGEIDNGHGSDEEDMNGAGTRADEDEAKSDALGTSGGILVDSSSTTGQLAALRELELTGFNSDASSMMSSQTGQRSGIADLIPTIIKLNAVLEDCFTHPSYCIRNLGDMIRDIHGIVDRPQDHKFLFQFDNDQSVDLAIDEFLQNIVLLAERQPQVISSILRVLVYLSTVAEFDMGKRCVQQLSDMMSGGENHAVEVITVINEFMVPLLDSLMDPSTHVLVIANLITLASSSTIPDGLDTSPLDNALAYIASQIRRQRSSAPPSDQVVELGAVASNNERIARSMGNLGLAANVTRELNEAQANSKRYLSLLTMIKNMANYDLVFARRRGHDGREGFETDAVDGPVSTMFQGPSSAGGLVVEDIFDESGMAQQLDHRSARRFAKEGVHRSILRALRKLAEERERNLTQREWSDLLVQQSILCLGALSHTRPVFVDLMDGRMGYRSLLFSLFASSSSGPVVLSAVFRALTLMLNAPVDWYPLRFDNALLEHHAVFAEITTKLQRVTPLLQYLGEKGTKFEAMCSLVPQEERELYFRGERRTLATLQSPSMHSLLVSVIGLISVYNREAATETNTLAVRITQELNDNKRESFLFACLNTPSDEVRLAVVKCLQQIQLSEFDHAEINYLVELLSNVINISSGKTEEVLGGSFKLLTKLCLSEHPSGVSFRLSFAEKSANAAFSILERNEMRDTRGQVIESIQKRILSTSCVEFLQACSLFRNLRNYLRSHEVLEKLITVLYIEDTNTDMVRIFPRNETEISRQRYWPNLIERTLCGRQVEYLLRTLVGFRSVSPTRVVAPRVLRRIADVLMGVPDSTLSMVRKYWAVREEQDGNIVQRIVDVPANGAGGTAQEEEDTDISKLPAWVVQEMFRNCDPNEDFRGLANRHTEKEKQMAPFWNTLMGRQVGVSDNWSRTEFLTSDARADKLQQHQLLIHFSGLERLLLFLVGAVESSEPVVAKPGGAAGSVDGGPFSESGGVQPKGSSNGVLPTTLSVSQLLNSFAVPDTKGILESVILRAQAAEHAKSRHEAQNEGERKRDVLGATPSGKETLLRFFMRESISGISSEDAARDASESSAGVLEVGSAEGTASRQNQSRYPHADTIMFQANAAELFRRDTEVTDTLVAGLRVIYSLICDGSPDTVEAARRILRIPSKLRILACICTGSRTHPVWPQALIGAKFMAIAYELCVMPGIRREEVLESLPIYSIVCTVAQRIMSTLRFFAEAQTLSESDLIVGLHTTRTLALIASQMQYLRMPDVHKEVSPAIRNLGLEAVWKTLIPFESTVKGCIALLIACSRRTGPDAATPEVEYCIREHVTQFLVSIFAVSSDSRYEVLEELVRIQIQGRVQLRNSYIQELLHRVAEASFQYSLRKFMENSGHVGQRRAPEKLQKTETPTSEELVIPPPSPVLTQKKEKPVNSGFFAFCAGSRSSKSQSTKAASTTSRRDIQHFISNEVVGSNGIARKVWAVEPPAPLTHKSLSSQNSSSATDLKSWEYDRIGTERILACSFVEALEAGTLLGRKLFVLTSEAYYMYDEPEDGRGWQVGASKTSKRSADDLYTNPTVFAQPLLMQREDFAPRLMWRKPYRAIERICLGMYGQCIHFEHRPSDLHDRPPSTTMTLVTYVTGVAARLYSVIMQMCREWGRIEVSLGLDPSKAKPPQEDADQALYDALAFVLSRMEGESLSLENGPAPILIRDQPKGGPQPADARSLGRGGDDMLHLSPSTCLFNKLEGLMCTQVLLVTRDRASIPSIILCTAKHFSIVEPRWGHWSFARDVAAERKAFVAKLEQETATRNGGGYDEGARARMIASKNAQLEARIEEETNQRRKLLKMDSRNRYTHSLLDLNEVILSKGDVPLLLENVL
ncbi:Hypothetical protein SCF082_LOCUS45929, partial [Durusdinium trenchii]